MIAPSSPPAAQHPLRQAGPVLAIVLGFLGLSVVVHAVALWHVASVQPDLVRADYYEVGERHDAELALRAAAAGRTVHIERDRGEWLVRVVPAAGLGEQDGALTLRRPAQAARDQVAPLRRDHAGGGWRASASSLAAGAWTARIELAGPPAMAWELPIAVNAAGRITSRAAPGTAPARGAAGRAGGPGGR